MNPILNPYAPGAGSQPPELAGRGAVRDTVRVCLERLRRSRQAKSVILVGLRGVGKTVLLEKMRMDAEAEGIHTIRTSASMALAVFVSGQRIMLASTMARVRFNPSVSGALICPTWLTQATISIPSAVFSIFSAMAPAQTRPIVSRAEARPPPEEARIPYFDWYVKSAWEGLGTSAMDL